MKREIFEPNKIPPYAPPAPTETLVHATTNMYKF